jgi:hypothetical protein
MFAPAIRGAAGAAPATEYATKRGRYSWRPRASLLAVDQQLICDRTLAHTKKSKSGKSASGLNNIFFMCFTPAESYDEISCARVQIPHCENTPLDWSSR